MKLKPTPSILIPTSELAGIRTSFALALAHILKLECELANLSDPTYSIATQPSDLQLLLQNHTNYIDTLLPDPDSLSV